MSSKYQIWLTHDGEKEKLRFPVLPETISLKQGSDNQTVKVAGLGEVTIMQDKPQAQVSWSCFFPASTFPGVQVDTLIWPEELKATIKTWMGSKKPSHLMVTGTKINLFVSIETFDCEESGGAVGDLTYNIVFREHRTITVRKVSVDEKSGTATVEQGAARTDNTVTPKTYTIVKGDCLYNIAKKQLGDASKWTEIASLNGKKAPYIIRPGEVISLPV